MFVARLIIPREDNACCAWTGFGAISANHGKLIETLKWATEKSFIADSSRPGAIFKRVTRLKIAPGLELSALKLFSVAHFEVSINLHEQGCFG